jgi:hypothetical protein
MTALAVGISASAIMVPPLVASWSSNSVTPGNALVPTAGPASPSVGTSATPTTTAEASFQPIRIAAGAAGNELFGRSAVVACHTCAAGSRVQYLGQGGFVVIYVRGVPVAGARTLTITYETHGARTLKISVNGAAPVSMVLSGKGDWTTPAEVTMPVMLPAGSSTIKFFNDGDPAPDLDEILIS